MQLEYALDIAKKLVWEWGRYCDRIDVAGSCRRRCANVGDIEIVLQPKLVEDWTYQLVRPYELIVSILSHRVVKGNPEIGKYVKIVVDGADVDIFIPSPHDYYRILAIRTGDREYSRAIALKWVAMGWVGTGDGLRRRNECEKFGDRWKCTVKNPVKPPEWKSELEFFDWLDMLWLEPYKRCSCIQKHT